MTESQIRSIVERVLADLLQRRTTNGERPKALVLFTGALLGFDAAVESLHKLSGDIDLHWAQTPSAERILDQSILQGLGMKPVSNSLSQEHDVLLLPTLTANVAAKAAHGIGDCLGSNVLGQFIMMGQPIVAAIEGVCPDSPDKRKWFPNMPASYQAMLRGTLSVLRDMGVTLTPARLFADATLKRLEIRGVVTGEVMSLVTEATVAEATPGSTILLAPRAIVTDLAREKAQARNITLTQRN